MIAANVTRDGVEVKVGQVWRDLDKRMTGRTRTVLAVVHGHATMGSEGTASTTRVAIRRMHKHSTGWALVSEGGEA